MFVGIVKLIQAIAIGWAPVELQELGGPPEEFHSLDRLDGVESKPWEVFLQWVCTHKKIICFVVGLITIVSVSAVLSHIFLDDELQKDVLNNETNKDAFKNETNMDVFNNETKMDVFNNVTDKDAFNNATYKDVFNNETNMDVFNNESNKDVFNNETNKIVFNNETNEDYVYDSLRLPLDFQPIYYRLRLNPRLDEVELPFTYQGRVKILMKCLKGTNRLILHVENLNITSIILQKENSNSIINETNTTLTEIKLEDCRTYNSYLICKSSEDFHSNSTYWLDTQFSGNISDHLTGFYRSNYHDENGKIMWLATTHLQPVYARKVFPCFDEPQFKSKFEISIARRTNMTVLSNMPIKETDETKKNSSGWVWDHFMETPSMPSYLVAFTICNFKSTNVTLNKTGPILKIWAPQHLLYSAVYASGFLANIFDFYQNYFGSKYPLNKLDLIAIPDFAKDAMENWGLISFSYESLLLHRRYYHDLDPKRHIFNTMAHAVAHQWFGNLISIEWWSDVWLSEGFATYMSYIAEEELQPIWKPLKKFPQEILHSALHADSLKTSHSLHADINKTEEIEQIFDEIMCDKAASLIRMLNYTLGKDNFLSGLKDYIQKFSFNVANETALWSSLEKYNPNKYTSVKDLMFNWTETSGYPLLSVIRNYQNGTINLCQSKYGEDTSKLTLWVIPLEYSTKNGYYEKIILNTSCLQINTSIQKDEWVIFNLNQAGYYRVSYDDQNLDLLIANNSEVPIENRAQLINDAFEHANLGYSDYELPFKIVNNLVINNETSEEVWAVILKTLSFMEYILIDTEHYETYKKYVTKLIEPKLNETTTFANLRSVELVEDMACNLNHTRCTKHALRLFHRNFRSTDLLNAPRICSVIENSDEKIWLFVWNITRIKYVSGFVLQNLYYGLSCSRKPKTIDSYLDSMLDEKIPVQYISFVWRSLARQHVGRMVGIKYLEDKWKDIYQVFKNKMGVMQSIIEEFLYNLSSESDYERVMAFSKNFEKELAPVAGTIKTAIEKIKWRVHWMDIHVKKIVDIFKNFTSV